MSVRKKKKITSITNFSEYFKNARDNFQDIYIQNISNAQISMSVPVGVNQTESITIPKTRKPYNLCQDVPFDALANSMDLRKLVNRRPEVLRLITAEEYMEYDLKNLEKIGSAFYEGIGFFVKNGWIDICYVEDIMTESIIAVCERWGPLCFELRKYSDYNWSILQHW